MAERSGRFDESSARRIAKVVKRVEAMPPNPPTRRREPRLSGGDLYVVVLTATLSFEASATATIQVGTPGSVTTGETITVWCSVLETGESIANGTKGYAKRTPTHYEFFGSACEVA